MPRQEKRRAPPSKRAWAAKGGGFFKKGLEAWGITLPETNMETQKGPSKVLLKGGYMSFHVSLRECRV